MTLTLAQLAGFRRWGYDTRGWAQSTQYRYSIRVVNCHNHLDTDLTAASTSDMLGWLSSLPTNPSTRNHARNAVHAYCCWMQDVSLRRDNPADDLPRLRIPKHLPRAYDPTIAAALLDAADRRGQRWAAAGALMFYGGLRASEITERQWADLTSDMLHVRGKGSEDRVVPLAPPALEAVNLWRPLADASDWMFPSPRNPSRHMSYTWLYRTFKAIAADVGVPAFHPHAGRHTCATTLVETGAHVRDIQALLGHSNLATTTRYLAARPQRVVDAVGRLAGAY